MILLHPSLCLHWSQSEVGFICEDYFLPVCILFGHHQSSLSFLCLLERTLTSIWSFDRYPWDFRYSQMLLWLPFSPFSVSFSSISLRVSLSLILTIFRISSFTFLPIEGTGPSLSFWCWSHHSLKLCSAYRQWPYKLLWCSSQVLLLLLSHPHNIASAFWLLPVDQVWSCGHWCIVWLIRGILTVTSLWFLLIFTFLFSASSENTMSSSDDSFSWLVSDFLSSMMSGCSTGHDCRVCFNCLWSTSMEELLWEEDSMDTSLLFDLASGYLLSPLDLDLLLNLLFSILIAIKVESSLLFIGIVHLLEVLKYLTRILYGTDTVVVDNNL